MAIPTLNIRVGDLVIVQHDGMLPGHWPLAGVVKTYPGIDEVLRVVTIKTDHGTYTCPVHKVVLLHIQEY